MGAPGALVHRLGGGGVAATHVYGDGTVLITAGPEGNEFCLVWQPDPGA